MSRPIACFLGAGFSSAAGVPLAKDLFRTRPQFVLSDGSFRRFEKVLEDYVQWESKHPNAHAEEYMRERFSGTSWFGGPHWPWIVEYIGAVIASVGTSSRTYNLNPRYLNRINRPTHCHIHQAFFRVLLRAARQLSVVTTNYDILIERALRHRRLTRPPSPGCYYGGLLRPQMLKGAAQPFSVHRPERLIEMSGSVPIFKLHGSLSWSLSGAKLITYQDLRPAFRNGGNAAIIPPVPEKQIPSWLAPVWDGALQALVGSDVWVVCGYSAPIYDTEVRRLLGEGARKRSVSIVLSSPDSTACIEHWKEIVPTASVIPVPGLPSGIEEIERQLSRLRSR